jgi:hypothetical protein
MLREEIRELKTGRAELRKFGLLVGGILFALGVLFWARGKARYPYFLAPGALLVVLGAAVPAALKQIYIAWMTLAILLGFIVSSVILTFFFFVVILPIGLVSRVFGKDFLTRKLDPQATTYWIGRARREGKSQAEYEQQF